MSPLTELQNYIDLTLQLNNIGERVQFIIPKF